MRPLFDSHLDLSWLALSFNRDLTLDLAELNQHEAHMTDSPARGHAVLTFPEMRRANMAVCLATFLARANPAIQPAQGHLRIDLDYVGQDAAYAIAHGQWAYYRRMEESGRMRFLRTRRDLDDHWQRWTSGDHLALGAILAMEGADPIVEPRQAQEWWELGLRSVGLAHYGPGQYAQGTGGEGALNSRGLELLKEFQRLGMIIDLTHCCDTSFFQAAEGFSGPLMASHQCCRALVPGQRQFSDEQLRLLIQRGAVIGVALDAWMLHPGWIKGQTSRQVLPLSAVADHLDHICQLAGNTRHAAIGSDLDGGFGTEQCPAGLDSIADLQKLEPILGSRGYSDSDIDRIFFGNWLDFFRRWLPRE